jgi:hypothetical protein
MATLHSGYEFEASLPSNARRHSAYIEPDAIEALRNAAATNSSSPPIGGDMKSFDQFSHTPTPSTPRPASMYESNIELNTLNPQHDSTNAAAAAAEAEFSLPPVDGGRDAWLFLFSAFILEVLVWGM